MNTRATLRSAIKLIPASGNGCWVIFCQGIQKWKDPGITGSNGGLGMGKSASPSLESISDRARGCFSEKGQEMLQKQQAQVLNAVVVLCIASENFPCPSSITEQLQKEPQALINLHETPQWIRATILQMTRNPGCSSDVGLHVCLSAFETGAPLGTYFSSTSPTSDRLCLPLTIEMIIRAFQGNPDRRMGQMVSFGFGNSL